MLGSQNLWILILLCLTLMIIMRVASLLRKQGSDR